MVMDPDVGVFRGLVQCLGPQKKVVLEVWSHVASSKMLWVVFSGLNRGGFKFQ